MSPKTSAAHALVRERVPFLDGDRRMEGDVKEIVDLVRYGGLRDAVFPI